MPTLFSIRTSRKKKALCAFKRRNLQTRYVQTSAATLAAERASNPSTLGWPPEAPSIAVFSILALDVC